MNSTSLRIIAPYCYFLLIFIQYQIFESLTITSWLLTCRAEAHALTRASKGLPQYSQGRRDLEEAKYVSQLVFNCGQSGNFCDLYEIILVFAFIFLIENNFAHNIFPTWFLLPSPPRFSLLIQLHTTVLSFFRNRQFFLKDRI